MQVSPTDKAQIDTEVVEKINGLLENQTFTNRWPPFYLGDSELGIIIKWFPIEGSTNPLKFVVNTLWPKKLWGSILAVCDNESGALLNTAPLQESNSGNPLEHWVNIKLPDREVKLRLVITPQLS